MQARRADASSIKRVPFEPAGAEPFVLFAARPAAERAADARRFRLAGLLLLLKLTIQNDGFRSVTHSTDALLRRKADFDPRQSTGREHSSSSLATWLTRAFTG
jgi:hypothetical protein